MQVADPRLLLVHRQQHLLLLHHPIRLVGERILRNLLHVVGLHQVFQRLWSLLLVQSVLRNYRSQIKQVLAQHRFLSSQDRVVVQRNGNGEQDQDHADHDHHLQQREAAALPVFAPVYHSLYFVPSSPVPSDLVNTSNTFCSPQESVVGSSCVERIPHSALPVMGSTGIFRRKRSFFPATSTPVTNVSRSGG